MLNAYTLNQEEIMNEKWIEEIKRNDEMTMLDRYFPGKSCGNTECEQHCIELCKIAERMGGMKKNEIASSVARLLVYPENCPALKSGRDHESCRFLLFSHDRISAYDDRTGRRIIGKKYISDADASKSGACKKCLEYANRIFKWPEEANKMPKLPLHPNCKCHYEDIYAPQVKTHLLPPKIHDKSEVTGHGKELFFREKNSPGKFGNFGGGLTFSGINDLIEQIEKSNIPPHRLDKLIIVSHSGIDDFYNMGNSDNLRYISDNQIERLKKYLHSKSIVDIRMCSAASGKDGEGTAQKLADKLGCQVVVYAGPVSPHGWRPLYIKDPDSKIPWHKKIFPDHKPKKYFPKIEKK